MLRLRATDGADAAPGRVGARLLGAGAEVVEAIGDGVPPELVLELAGAGPHELEVTLTGSAELVAVAAR